VGKISKRSETKGDRQSIRISKESAEVSHQSENV
jgi:hypothetical protein